MRRVAACLLATMLLNVAIVPGAQAQRAPQGKSAAAGQSHAPARGGPPHAWLFGSWTGGLFPVLDGALAQDCRTQPTVVFGQDVVAHASLIGATLAQRVIETVRTTPQGAEFRFTPDANDPAGFGCPDSNDLYVQRSSDSEISFPRCVAFPYPLHRCPG